MDRVRAKIDALRTRGMMVAPCGHRLRLHGPADVLEEDDRAFLLSSQMPMSAFPLGQP